MAGGLVLDHGAVPAGAAESRFKEHSHVHSYLPMNDRDTDRGQERICRCSGTTLSQLQTLVERGITELDGISQASGACSGCGGCETDILAWLAEHFPKASKPAPRP